MVEGVRVMTAKEITIEYLESIKKDLAKTMSKQRTEFGWCLPATRHYYRAIIDAIAIVNEAEGE